MFKVHFNICRVYLGHTDLSGLPLRKALSDHCCTLEDPSASDPVFPKQLSAADLLVTVHLEWDCCNVPTVRKNCRSERLWHWEHLQSVTAHLWRDLQDRTELHEMCWTRSAWLQLIQHKPAVSNDHLSQWLYLITIGFWIKSSVLTKPFSLVVILFVSFKNLDQQKL